jgi:hypothetical protein
LPIAGELPPYDGRTLARDLSIVSRHRLAEKVTGGLSLTTKVPCPSWGIPAIRCRTGSVLADGRTKGPTKTATPEKETQFK